MFSLARERVFVIGNWTFSPVNNCSYKSARKACFYFHSGRHAQFLVNSDKTTFKFNFGSGNFKKISSKNVHFLGSLFSSSFLLAHFLFFKCFHIITLAIFLFFQAKSQLKVLFLVALLNR